MDTYQDPNSILNLKKKSNLLNWFPVNRVHIYHVGNITIINIRTFPFQILKNC